MTEHRTETNHLWAGILISIVYLTCLSGNVSAANDSAAEVAETDSKVQLTFPDNVALKTVVDYVAVRLGKNIIYDDAMVKQPVTIRSPIPVSKSELQALLRSALRFRGLALIEAEQKGWLKIVRHDHVSRSVPLWLVRPPSSTDSNSIVTRLIELKHISVRQFTGLVNPLLSKPAGSILELPTGQALIVTDYKSVIDALHYLQELVDVPRLARRWKIYALKNAPISRIANDLKILVDQTIGTSGKKDDKGSTVPGPSPIPIVQLNAFLLNGTSEQIDQMESLLRLLDVQKTIVTQIYPLKHTGSQRAAVILKQLILPLQQNESSSDRWVIASDTEANSLIVTCPEMSLTRVTEWIKNQIDVPSEVTTAGLSTRIFQVKYALANELAGTLQSVFAIGGTDPIQLHLKGLQTTGVKSRSEKKKATVSTPARPMYNASKNNTRNSSPSFSLTVHEPTNSIIITAPKQVLTQVDRLIGRLDHHRPQVLVEATIVSISESQSMDLGVEIQHLRMGQSGLDRGVLTSFGLLNIDLAAGSSSPEFGTGFNAVLLRPNEVSIILRAIRSRLNGKVIARPQLLIDDNATGSLNSITEHPYTSINSGQTISTTSFGGYAQAGTQLTLTPHISEGGVVHLQYEIRSSSFTGGSISENTPPPRATDSIRSQVTIPNGYVLLVGGLTREDMQKARSEVPFLADIPILGELFRIRSDSSSRTMLYVFLRPRIMREDRFAYLKYLSKEALGKARVDSETPVMEMEFLQ